VAALFDTTVGVLLLRRKLRADALRAIEAAKAEIRDGGAVLPAAAAAELLVGERDAASFSELSERLAGIPTAVLPAEAAGYAGSMGAFLAGEGAAVPFPNLLIAATAVWLEIPLLAWDGDYPRARNAALASDSPHPGAELWRRMLLHPASLGA